MKSFRIQYSKITLSKALVIIIIFAVTILLTLYIIGNLDENTNEEDYSEESLSEDNSDCNVTGIEIRGTLVTYTLQEGNTEGDEYATDETASEDIIGAINYADEDEATKAILLEIDSYGGYPIAGEEIAKAIKNANKPTVALIRGSGLSAAYYAATGADIIFASKLSDVGSIGTTMSYLDYAKTNEKDGLTYNQLSTGKYKDAGDPDKPLTADEKALFMRDVNKITDYFIIDVAKNRNLDIEKVKALADGSSMLGEMALENGLIDRIGSYDEAEGYIKEMIGEEVGVCW